MQTKAKTKVSFSGVKERDSFIFYRSFYEAICEADDDTQLQVYKAIAEYALNGSETDLKGVASIIFKLAKPQLDANWKRFVNGCKGGAPIGNGNAIKDDKTTEKQPKNNQDLTEKQPNGNLNNNLNDNPNVNPNEKDLKKRNEELFKSLSPEKQNWYKQLFTGRNNLYRLFMENPYSFDEGQFEYLCDRFGVNFVAAKLESLANKKECNGQSIYGTLLEYLAKDYAEKN